MQNLTDNVRNTVKHITTLGIRTFEICELVLGNYGIAPTPTDVNTVTIDVDPETTLAEREALMKFLVDTSGTGETYFIHSGLTEIWLTLGYRVTSLAESANGMIRRYTSNRLLSLTEMHRWISTTYRFKHHGQVQGPFLSPRM
jgi:hypothetical protein